MSGKKRSTRWVKAGLVAAVLVAVAWWPLERLLILGLGVSELNIVKGLLMQRLGVAAAPATNDRWVPPDEPPPAVELDPSIVAFRDIGDRLGPRALASNIFVPHGAAVFDANGDGRVDIYMVHSGQPVAKATTADHVLTKETMPAQPCTLFVNLGNDDAGEPVFKSLQELAQGNDEYVREELLIENKYRPRSSLEEDELAPGRLTASAMAGDFNGDGRLDLYVLNSHYGIGFQTHQLGLRAYPSPRNLSAFPEETAPFVIRVPSFLWGERLDGSVTTVEYGPTPEIEGRNSLYLNLGDRDGDGLPEWRDATDELGVGGRWASVSGAVSDFDRDGDLDIYVANFADPDFWGFGDFRFGGNRNEFYVNQLMETGKLGFRDRAVEMGVAGLHDEEDLEAGTWFPSEGRIVPTSEHVVEGRQVGEKADHTWAVLFIDWNEDHWPDLVVANDLTNRLRIYENLQGRGFRRWSQFDASQWDGCWMGMSAGDLDGDQAQEIFITNCGSQVMTARNISKFIKDWNEPNVQALAVINYPLGHTTLHNVLLRYDPETGFRDAATEVTIHHSPYIPPDMSLAVNFPPDHRRFLEQKKFTTSLTGTEFGWNAPMFDIDNDGDLDIYLAGSLMRGNDEFVGDWSANPGRALVNESTPGNLVFRDLTLEYRLLDISHMDYDATPPRRRAPGTGWHKGPYIYLTDTETDAAAGLTGSAGVTRDIFRMHETAHAVLVADLNNDGNQDIVVTHTGGYDSNSPEAGRMKVDFAGRVLAAPAPNKLNKPATSFEEGPTFVYINGGPPRGQAGHWVKLELRDPDSGNVYGVGARVVANGKAVRHALNSGLAFGSAVDDLHFGLGTGALERLEITWPSGDPTPQVVHFDPPIKDQRICVDRQRGPVPCDAEDGAHLGV